MNIKIIYSLSVKLIIHVDSQLHAAVNVHTQSDHVMEFGPSLASLSRFLFKRQIMLTPFSLPSSLYLRVPPGGLGAV